MNPRIAFIIPTETITILKNEVTLENMTDVY